MNPLKKQGLKTQLRQLKFSLDSVCVTALSASTKRQKRVGETQLSKAWGLLSSYLPVQGLHRTRIPRKGDILHLFCISQVQISRAEQNSRSTACAAQRRWGFSSAKAQHKLWRADERVAGAMNMRRSLRNFK